MLYGQVDGFTQKDIPNRVNRHFEGVITIDAEGHNVVIRRGVMPNAFAVTVDGEPVDTAGKNNIQKYLENEIYKTPMMPSASLQMTNLKCTASPLTQSTDMCCIPRRTMF